MTDWNPSDPDAVRVVYDLSAWNIDQQAELASALAEAEVPHMWDESDLMVPEEAEQAADLVIAEVEAKLGIVDDVVDASGNVPQAAAFEAYDAVEPVELAEGTPTTEYDLSEWPPADRMALSHALTNGELPFRWDGQHVLLVATDHEDVVDALLDQIERGEYTDTSLHAAGLAGDADRLPFETLTTFFLAGERLRRDPLDADGIEELLAATEVADPSRPPYGVQPRLWQRTCELADRLAVALVGELDDDDDDDGDDDEIDAAGDGGEVDAAGDADEVDPFDHDLAVQIATQLHDLLRPYV